MIVGSRTALRAVEAQDLPLLRDWRNRADFRRNFREYRELSMRDQERWYAAVSDSRNDFMFVIIDVTSNEAIGACGLLCTNWIIRAADVSFYIGRDGAYIDDDGLALDAAVTLLRYGFEELNLHKAWMELYEFDVRKIQFFTQQLGFRKDGTLRANCFTDGRYWDSYIVSLLAEEFRSPAK